MARSLIIRADSLLQDLDSELEISSLAKLFKVSKLQNPIQEQQNLVNSNTKKK